MPSGGSKPLCPPRAQHSRGQPELQPRVTWSREARSFVTHTSVTLNYCSWQRAARLGKFVPLVTFSWSCRQLFPVYGNFNVSCFADLSENNMRSFLPLKWVTAAQERRAVTSLLPLGNTWTASAELMPMVQSSLPKLTRVTYIFKST